MAKRRDPIEQFESLPDGEKERVWQELDRMTTEELDAKSRPLNAGERRLWRQFKRKVGRPKIGKGVKVISVGVEKRLLKQADALARKRGMNRSALVSAALKAMLASAA
jgi:hypothetical protein